MYLTAGSWNHLLVPGMYHVPGTLLVGLTVLGTWYLVHWQLVPTATW